MNYGRTQRIRFAHQNPTPAIKAVRKAANEAALADRIIRARESQPPRDPTGEWHRSIAALAQETGRELDALLDEWDERAAVYEYDAKETRAEAERLAFEAVAELYHSERGVR